ncbi:hypothetical protein ACIQAC_15285 [Streptomyces sp. NPDC088387]|uniref:hypothetical protein n=1 Tax=Streptomyces sp. NPDC088387 TaxID=3365859 RepID=UPI00381BCBB4
MAHGLWRGDRGARIMAILCSFGPLLTTEGRTIAGPLVMVLLLTAPRSSRAWFSPEPPDANRFVDEYGDDEDDGLAAGRG